MYQNLFLLCLVSLTIFVSFENAFAMPEPILITISPSMEHVIFDGKWTNTLEWKQSSHNPYIFEDDQITIHLRTAHFGDFIYVFVDPINDLTLDKHKDKTTICFDGNNNKSKVSDIDDFCFSVLLGNTTGTTFQGNSINESNSFTQIPNPDNFIAISTISDENDRYTITPHPSYEFKIPIKLLKRSDNYGFYFSVYDASLDKFYSWPKNSTEENPSDIPSPSTWGNIISPDKSLPELNLPILIFTIMTFTIVLVQYRTKISYFR